MSDGSPKLTKADLSVLRGVCEMPLVSAKQLAAIQGVVFSTVWRRLVHLEALGQVHSEVMGAMLAPALRYCLAPGGAVHFTEPETYFHFSRMINRLGSFLPAVEWHYQCEPLVAQETNLGDFRSFQWRFREGVDAFIHYDNGTVAMFWSGPWQTKEAFGERLNKLAQSTREIEGWPAALCVVASDLWQARRMLDVLSAYGLQHQSLVVVAEPFMVSTNPVVARQSDLLSPSPCWARCRTKFQASCLG